MMFVAPPRIFGPETFRTTLVIALSSTPMIAERSGASLRSRRFADGPNDLAFAGGIIPPPKGPRPIIGRGGGEPDAGGPPGAGRFVLMRPPGLQPARSRSRDRSRSTRAAARACRGR